MAKDLVTEEKIFEAARSVFQKRGYAGARMQEIADEAGINKAMLHYYFRSKDQLFAKVLQAGIKEVVPQVFAILEGSASLEEKVEAVVNFYHNTFRENQHLPRFVIHEMQQNPERFNEFMEQMNLKIPGIFKRQFEEAVKLGKIRPIRIEHLIVNMLSMCMFPFVAQNMLFILFNFDSNDFDAFIEERRQLIPAMVFNGVSVSREDEL